MGILPLKISLDSNLVSPRPEMDLYQGVSGNAEVAGNSESTSSEKNFDSVLQAKNADRETQSRKDADKASLEKNSHSQTKPTATTASKVSPKHGGAKRSHAEKVAHVDSIKDDRIKESKSDQDLALAAAAAQADAQKRNSDLNENLVNSIDQGDNEKQTEADAQLSEISKLSATKPGEILSDKAQAMDTSKLANTKTDEVSAQASLTNLHLEQADAGTALQTQKANLLNQTKNSLVGKDDAIKGQDSLQGLFGNSEEGHEKGSDLLAIRGLDDAKGLAADNQGSSEASGKSLQHLADGLWVQKNLEAQMPDSNLSLVQGTSFETAVAKADGTAVSGASQVRANLFDDLKPLVSHVLRTNDGGEMTLNLRPANLGAVKVEVQVDAGTVKVAIQAEQSSAKNALQSQIADLKHQLSSAGLKVSDVSVAHMQNAQNSGTGSNARDSQTQQQNPNFQQNSDSSGGNSAKRERQARGFSEDHRDFDSFVEGKEKRANA